MLSNLFITVMSFILDMTVYGRFFHLYILLPWPRPSGTTFAGTGPVRRKQFIKSLPMMAMEGVRDRHNLPHFSAFMSSGFPGSGHQLDPVVLGLAVHRGDYFQYAIGGWPGKGARHVCRRCSAIKVPSI